MRQSAVEVLVAMACAVACGAAAASDVVVNRMVTVAALDATCAAAPGAADPVASREQVLAHYEALPPQCLRAMFRVCNRAAESGLLDLGQAAHCSIGYEALLRRGFDGDFHALMGWWQRQRHAPGVVGN